MKPVGRSEALCCQPARANHGRATYCKASGQSRARGLQWAAPDSNL
jgi:hypothetical protein